MQNYIRDNTVSTYRNATSGYGLSLNTPRLKETACIQASQFLGRRSAADACLGGGCSKSGDDAYSTSKSEVTASHQKPEQLLQ